ncbi:UNVERIFIED_CONTAM: hypothetical protein HDU68_009033 [Siphonaria sp. JEL0065]|nr:hypothetical protein HDU68_009033 [Siphonaria sp. JEL0065]
MSLDLNEKGNFLVGLEGSDLIQVKEFGNEKVLGKTSHRVIIEGHSVTKNQEVWGCAMNPKNPEEYVTSGDDSMIMIRNIRSKKTVARAHLQGKLKAAAYSPDGKYIAVGNENGDVKWTIPGGQQLQNPKGVKWETSTCTWFESTLRENEVTTVDRHPDKPCIATGDDYGCIKLYSTLVTKPLMPYKLYSGHASNVTNVAFDSSGEYMVSTGGADGCVFEWHVQKT